jgi:hypothetical protein
VSVTAELMDSVKNGLIELVAVAFGPQLQDRHLVDKRLSIGLVVGIPDFLCDFRKDRGEPFGPWLAKDP